MVKKRVKKKEDDCAIIELAGLSKAEKNQLKKDYGNIFLSAKDIIERKRVIFPVSPKLDLSLNGGIPSGCWGIISGASKLGKSTLALTLCSQAQKPEFGNRKCYYHDVECRLEKKNIEGIPGLQLTDDKLEIIKSTQGNVLTAEKHLSIAEYLLKNQPGIVLVLDSSSALCTTKEYDGDISATGRNEGPRLLAQFTRKLANIVPPQDSLVIIIQHMIANTSGRGVPWMEDGGYKIIYQSDFKLRGTSFKKWEEGGKHIGQVNNWSVVYSALGQPGAKVESYLRFGEGIDTYMEMIDLACECGIIDLSGSWFDLLFLDNPIKIQGQGKLREWLKENPKEYAILKEKVKEFYDT